VKSPPELWAECSDAASLARHLDRFGEIRITRLDPETAVAWEGERARGTVRIEPAGWGTKVILTAVADAPAEPEVPVDVAEAPWEPEVPVDVEDAPAEPEPLVETGAAESDPPGVEALTKSPVEEPPPPARKRRFARLRAFWRGEPLAAPEPAAEAATASETEAATETPVPVIQAPPPEPEAPPWAVEVPPPEPEAPPRAAEASPPDPAAQSPAVSETEAALAAALDSLGQAHHRPYSRA
jgi:hypothetical protein